MKSFPWILTQFDTGYTHQKLVCIKARNTLKSSVPTFMSPVPKYQQWIANLEQLTEPQKRVLAFHRDHLLDLGRSPILEDVAAQLGMDMDSCADAVEILVLLGYLHCIRNAPQTYSPVYRHVLQGTPPPKEKDHEHGKVDQ